MRGRQTGRKDQKKKKGHAQVRNQKIKRGLEKTGWGGQWIQAKLGQKKKILENMFFFKKKENFWSSLLKKRWNRPHPFLETQIWVQLLYQVIENCPKFLCLSCWGTFNGSMHSKLYNKAIQRWLHEDSFWEPLIIQRTLGKQIGLNKQRQNNPSNNPFLSQLTYNPVEGSLFPPHPVPPTPLLLYQ